MPHNPGAEINVAQWPIDVALHGLHDARAVWHPLPASAEPASCCLWAVCLCASHPTPRHTTPWHADAVEQTLVQAEVAFNLGLIDTRQRQEAEVIQNDVVELVLNRQWTAARRKSDELLAYITNASATSTLEDIRRDKAYDAEDRVSAYLNIPEVKDNINAPRCIFTPPPFSLSPPPSCVLLIWMTVQHLPFYVVGTCLCTLPAFTAVMSCVACSKTLLITAPLWRGAAGRLWMTMFAWTLYACRDVVYAACSKEVDAIMGHDVMKSVSRLVSTALHWVKQSQAALQ